MSRQLIALVFALACVPNAASAVQITGNVEKEVREYFEDIPVMTDIARCESEFRQYTEDGSVLRGGAGGAMLGVFQINENVHLYEAAKMGLNIATLDGNLGYAKYLYEQSGTDPWMSSSHCWFDAEEEDAVRKTAALSNSDREKLESQIQELLRLINELQKLLAQLRALQ